MSTPIITQSPRIHDRGGALRIGGTNVTLETVLWAFQQGSTPEDIVDQFPTLSLADVYEAIGYYLRHRDQIDRYLAAQEQRYREAVEGLIQQAPPTPIQTRLRNRRQR